MAAIAAEQAPLLVAVTAVAAEVLLALVVLSLHAITTIDEHVTAIAANTTNSNLRFTLHLRRAG